MNAILNTRQYTGFVHILFLILQTTLLGKYHHLILQEETSVQEECGENSLKANLGQILENSER